MSKDQAKAFYSIHSDKPFFEELTTFMSSGNIAVLALQKENAVHGADSDENAQKEIDFFFTRRELIYTT